MLAGTTVAREASGPEYGIYAYTAREWDPEINLYYYRARYYDPKIGRFISEDPIGFYGGVNFFAYVGGNPTGYTDPYGHFGGIAIGGAWALYQAGLWTAGALTAIWAGTALAEATGAMDDPEPVPVPVPVPPAQPPDDGTSPEPGPSPVPIPIWPQPPDKDCPDDERCAKAWGECIQQFKNMPGRTPLPGRERVVARMFTDHMKRCMKTKGCEGWRPPR
jgi:RHS repeat-associated protein